MIKDQRASLFLKAVGRKFIKTVPDDVAYAIGSSPSLKAAQLVLRNYMGDLSVKVEIDSIVRQADDMVDGSWKVDLEELNNVNDKLVNKWWLEQQHRIMTDRYNFVVDLLNEKQSKELRQYLIDTGAICEEL